MRNDVRQTGKRPREAYSQMMASVPKRFKESSEQKEIVKVLPTFSEVQAQLCRHRQQRCTPVPDPLNIPDVLRTTLRGREVADGDPNKDEPFLIYTGHGGRLLVFCARTELEILRQSKYLICDGTFEMCPDSAYQLYTIHGFACGEAIPLAWCLLPNKTQATYEEMFRAISDGLITTYGDTGDHHVFLVDYEMAAINGIRAVFPDAVIKGCTFHFRQAVYRRVQQEGLKAEYEDKSNPTVRNWIRQIMSMTMLPSCIIPHAWTWLRRPPSTGSATTDAKLEALAVYFDQTWISGTFPLDLWSHYDNPGPRTTNHAEGFHNSLNTRFGLPHPSLRVFLDWLQKLQFEIQSRVIQLSAGRPAKRRQAEYVANDANLWSARVDYGKRLESIFNYLYPHPRAWDELRITSENYLRHCSYMLGC